MKNLEPTKKTKVKTIPKRASYDVETINKILDDTFICHIGFVAQDHPFVIPTGFGRKENKLYFHGAKGSRMLKALKNGIDICLTVTLIDGIVLARSAFHHSINYRSVVAFGKAEEIFDQAEKTKALKIISNHIIPGRWEDVRKPNDKELNATAVFSLDINEASAKIRVGNPIDDEEDINLKVWAGVLPLKIIAGNPIPDAILNYEMPVPLYLKNYKKN
ncbi:MAG: pyridoxamine 5'-phosphate oxidase family protein [Ignavibacteriaceae bacterium]